MRRFVVLSTCIAIAYGQQPDTLANFNAALYNPGNDGIGNHGQLEVFPLHGKPFAIPLPFACGSYFYGPDGEVLYCCAMEGLLKIGLHPVRTKLISGSKAFSINSLAIPAHKDKIIISGVRNQVTQVTEVRGIFELNPVNGESRVLA